MKRRTEALVTDVQIPQVDSQIISRDVCFLVRIDRDGVNVVGVGVRVDLSRDGGDNVILLRHSRKTKQG